MSKYLDNLNDEVKNYFKILSNEFPEWLNDYIETKEMQRIGKISTINGLNYCKIFDIKYWYSNLDHSVGVALIIWNFTHDKKQTLAGLFHDISIPTFKHCIDFMNNDHEKQESTEKDVKYIIENSKEIMDLLKRDNIKLEEVCDYKIYPIADNNTPQLSADRFEYTFASGLNVNRVWELADIEEFYNNIIIVKNEDGIDELAFKDIKVCEKYVERASILWPIWISNEDQIIMQFIADIMKLMTKKGYITVKELYEKSEHEVIARILNCGDANIVNAFKSFQNTTEAFNSDEHVDGKYCTTIKSKKRYIIPLILLNNNKVDRISNISASAKENIDKLFNYKTTKYVYFNFPFNQI